MLPATPSIDALEALRRIAGRLAQNAIPAPADAAWAAQAIRAFLSGQARTLDDATGLAPKRGHERPLRTLARGERNALLRHIRTVLYSDAPVTVAAALIARDLKRFAASAAVRRREEKTGDDVTRLPETNLAIRAELFRGVLGYNNSAPSAATIYRALFIKPPIS